MLDNVLQNFIDNAPDVLWRAKNSAIKERSLGLGAMGFHGYLQKRGIPFESPVALGLNRTIFSNMYHKAKAASGLLATERGEPEDMRGTGYRNAHVIAIAPNASSSYICGNSTPGIEPLRANMFKAETLSGVYFIKNKFLEIILDKYGKNNDTTWNAIALNKGSVQDLSFLSEQEKETFKTAMELDQRWLIEHASIRQPFIDQGQSVNLFFEPNVDPNFFHNVHFLAWKKGLKGLYYCRSNEAKKASTIQGKQQQDTIVEGPVNLLGNVNMVTAVEDTCVACQG
jgi:ribonucleoside-diphosphate reductase alpha chain